MSHAHLNFASARQRRRLRQQLVLRDRYAHVFGQLSDWGRYARFHHRGRQTAERSAHPGIRRQPKRQRWILCPGAGKCAEQLEAESVHWRRHGSNRRRLSCQRHHRHRAAHHHRSQATLGASFIDESKNVLRQPMIRSKIAMGFLWALLALALHVVPGPVGPAHAQGTRKDDIVFNSRGIPLAGATVRVCAMPASGQPCTPLALIYSDAALTQALANPTASDGLGNYSFYAAPGKYEIEISGPGITTKQIPDVLISPDPSSPNFPGNISAFSLNLSGNLTVNGNATVVGNLASGTLNLTNQSTPPGTATSGTVNLYTKTADKRVYYKDDAGTEIGPLGPGTGAQTNVVNTFTANQNFDNGMHIKGPDPYADITRFGKFATLSGTTANTSRSTTQVRRTPSLRQTRRQSRHHPMVAV